MDFENLSLSLSLCVGRENTMSHKKNVTSSHLCTTAIIYAIHHNNAGEEEEEEKEEKS